MMAERSIDERLAAGRDALERHDWQTAYDVLADASRTGAPSGEGLELLAWAAYWTGRPDETFEVLERAYAAHLDEDDQASAAMMAFRLAELHGMRTSMPQAQGWAARAARLAETHPDWPVQGWLRWMQGLLGRIDRDLPGAVARYDEALDLAARSGDRDLTAMSLHDKGQAMCLQGALGDGMALLDECMAMAVGGELSPSAAGYVFCGMIGICSKLGDYGRASEWVESTVRWCERQSIPAFTGVCRVHRAELLRLHGALAEAEAETLTACEELPRYNFYSGLGPANYEMGEIRRRLGDLPAAEAAYSRADGYGYQPQPGRSLLRLAQGNVTAAAVAIREALMDAGEDRCTRIRLLAAQAEVALAAGDLAMATAVAEQLDATIERFDAASLRAIAASTRGAVLLASEDVVAALRSLQQGRAAWREIDAPYEAADVELLLARAHSAIGDHETAHVEASSARQTFEELGARPAVARADRVLAEVSRTAEGSRRVERAFMFTDIVRSTDLVRLIGDDAWDDLLSWHDRTLRGLFDARGGEIAHPTGDGFFVVFPDAASAIACAVEIQRALDDHRRSYGFALSVRIGIHAGEATERGRDYAGAEVHRAARIAAAADGGEILASEGTVRDVVGGVDLVEVGAVPLKGFTEPVALARVGWRLR